jgi:hypothetical protein
MARKTTKKKELEKLDNAPDDETYHASKKRAPHWVQNITSGLALAGKGRIGPRLTTGLNGCAEKGAEGEIKAGAGPRGRKGPTHQNRGQTDPNREQSTHRRRKKGGPEKKKAPNRSQIQTWKLVGRRLPSFLPSPPLPSPWSAICSLIPVWSMLLPSLGASRTFVVEPARQSSTNLFLKTACSTARERSASTIAIRLSLEKESISQRSGKT